MNYPMCFSRLEDYAHWRDLARQARECASPCTDCPTIYEQKMLAVMRCRKDEVIAMHTYAPTTKKRIKKEVSYA